jgi:hypothetical protein
MICYTLEAARRGIQIDFMENWLRIPIFLTTTRRVYSIDIPQISGLAGSRNGVFVSFAYK